MEPQRLFSKFSPETKSKNKVEQYKDDSTEDAQNLQPLTEESEFYENSDDSVKDPDFIPKICRAKKKWVYIFA